MSQSPTGKLNIAMLSIHSTPLGSLGRRDNGGMSVYVLELSRLLGKKGHSVDIYTAQHDPKAAQQTQLFPGVRLIHVSCSQGKFAGCELSDPAVIAKFAAEIDSFRQQQTEQYDLVHSNYWISGLVGEILKKSWKSPHVVTFHTLASAKIAASADHKEQTYRLEREQYLVKSSDIILAPIRLEQQRLFELNGKPTDRVKVLGCGVDLEKFSLPTNTQNSFLQREESSAKRIVFVGRFDPMKGLPDVVHSFALVSKQCSELRLVLIGGDGPASAAWQQLKLLAQDLGIEEKIEFLGRIKHEQLPEYYHSAEIVVMPSRYESFGLVTLEALACGIPVAATRVGIAADVIKNGTNGYLADPGNPASLAEAIRSTLDLAKECSHQSIRSSAEKYGWGNVANELIDVYNNSLNTSSKNAC